MGVRVGKAVFHQWASLKYPNGWTDTFILDIDACSGLPPADYAEVIKMLASELKRLRRGAALWVKLHSPGNWYVREMRRVLRWGVDSAVAVSAADSPQPELADFSLPPKLFAAPSGGAPEAREEGVDMLSPTELSCVRVLARMQKAYTGEVAAQALLRLDDARRILRDLEKMRLVQYRNEAYQQMTLEGALKKQGRSYPYWEITRAGTSLALRSWSVPPEFYFPERKEMRQPGAGRHRRVSRLWPAWVKRAWKHAKVWTGWSEVRIPSLDATPDGLAWGEIDGGEALFWLEVESGHSSAREIQRKMMRRLGQAAAYSEGMGVRLVFVILGMPWVVQAAAAGIAMIGKSVAVVGGDWKKFGELPVMEWGRFRFSL